MKKNLFIVSLLILSGSLNLLGQDLFFKLNGGIALPIGKMSDSIKMGYGGTATCGYNFDENVAITLTSGYLHFPGKEISTPTALNTTEHGILPILVGTLYSVPVDEKIKAYAKFDFGVFVMKTTVTSKIIELDYKEGSASNSETKFGMLPTIGGDYKLNDNLSIDLNLSFTYVASVDKPTEWLGIFTGIKYTLL